MTRTELAADDLISSQEHDDLVYQFLTGKLHWQAFLHTLQDLHDSYYVARGQRNPDDQGDSVRSLEREETA